jgi:tetratricopeptide (TPR) repeat protein
MGTLNITSLKHADKFVREGNLVAALALIRKVRSDEPTNRYAEAYEERVCTLLGCPVSGAADAKADSAKTAEAAAAALTSPVADLAALLGNAYEAYTRDDATGALEILAQARALDPANTDIPALEDLIRTACSAPPEPAEPDIHYIIVRDTIQAYIGEATDLASREEFDEALRLVARGYMLDAMDEGLHACELIITEARTRAQERKAELEAQQMHEAEHAQLVAQREQQLHHHIARARELLSSSTYDEALTEVALGLLIDPDSLTLHALEQVIWKDKNDHAAAEAGTGQPTEHSRLIRLYILAAEEFSHSGDFTRALDELAKAYVLDPANSDVKRSEVKIRQQELRHHQQSAKPPLKLIYHHDRVANGE